MTRLRIATAAYPVEALPDWGAYEAKLDTWVAEAAKNADLLVFPEYAGLEAAMAGVSAPPEEPKAWRDMAAAVDGDLAALHAGLAARHHVTILSGSSFAAEGAGFVNRARLHLPSGAVGVQDKIVPTPYERTELDLRGGAGLAAFETPFGRIGVLICYDGEFPILARALAEAGCWLILVPSATDKIAGYWRVRIGAMARALEQRCITVQAPLTGAVPGCPIIDLSTGAGGRLLPARRRLSLYRHRRSGRNRHARLDLRHRGQRRVRMDGGGGAGVEPGRLAAPGRSCRRCHAADPALIPA